MTEFHDWFFMRSGFSSFRLEPDKHQALLFGEKDRARRDLILSGIEEGGYTLEGHKSVIYGDYGRGKSHQSKNLQWEIGNRGMPIYPIYVKCTEFKAKEPFSTLFRDLLLSIRTKDLQAMAGEYGHRLLRGSVPSMSDVTGSEDLGIVFEKGLTAPSPEVARQCVRWLGGEDKVDMSLISSALPAKLNVSKEYGAVMKGIVQLFREVGVGNQKVPLYFVDECERLANISQTDAYWSWAAALRELTDIGGVGLVFFVGAKGKDQLPGLFLEDEIRTRIGIVNYLEFYNLGREELQEFMHELSATLLRKGPVPTVHRKALEALGVNISDDSVPGELLNIVKTSDVTLESFPFTTGALEAFVESCALSDLSNKPREVLIRLEKCAKKAMRKGLRVINPEVVDETLREAVS